MAWPKITIVGAGNVGATTASLILLRDIANVVLIDVAEGIAKGKALDLMHMRSNEHFRSTVMGTGDYALTAKSDIVIVTAGVPRKPGMKREDLLEINAGIVRDVLESALLASPDALYIFVTNPLDTIMNLAARISGLPYNRLMGMGGVLDTARFTYAIAQETGVSPELIKAIVVGAHGEAMVPLPRFSTVLGTPVTEILDEEALNRVIRTTIQGGAEVVRLLEAGSAFYAPASSIVRMVEAILNNSGELLSVCVHLNGEYGITDTYMCVPVHLDSTGVRDVLELDLNTDELKQLQNSAASIKAQIALVDE